MVSQSGEGLAIIINVSDLVLEYVLSDFFCCTCFLIWGLVRVCLLGYPNVGRAIFDPTHQLYKRSGACTEIHRGSQNRSLGTQADTH